MVAPKRYIYILTPGTYDYYLTGERKAVVKDPETNLFGIIQVVPKGDHMYP